MKQRNLLLVSLGVIAVLAASVIAALPLFVSPSAISDRVQAQAELITGRQVSFRDTPRILWRPFLGVEISNVVLEDPHANPEDAPLAQIEKLHARLSILSALTGKVRIERYQFIRPKFNLVARVEGKASWAFPQGNVSHLLGEARKLLSETPAADKPDFSAIEPARLGNLQIVDGTVQYHNAKTGRQETFTNLNLEFSWPDTAVPARISGQAIWREEAIQFALNCPQLLPLLAGGSSPLEMSMSSAAFELAFKGEANTLADVQLTGDIQLSSPSMRRLVSFLGRGTANGATLADFSLSAKMDATRSQIKLMNAAVKLDGNSAKGALQITQLDKSKPLIAGTLAYGTLNLDPYAAALRQEISLASEGVAILGVIDTVELDLRISANNATFGGFSATELAASISARNGEGIIDIGNARLYSGILVGSAAIGRKNGRPQAALKGRLTGFSLPAFFEPGKDGSISLSGTGDLEADIHANGASAHELSISPRGTIKLAVKDGALLGMDLAELRDGAGTEGEAGAPVELSGRTPFSKLETSFTIYRDLAWMHRLSLVSPEISAIARGSIKLPGGGMAVRMRLGPGGSNSQTVSSGGETQSPADFVLGGSMSAPIVNHDMR